MFLITSCHFSGQSISSLFLISCPFLLFVLSPHPFLSLLFPCYLCRPNFHIVRTDHICVLTSSTRMFCWICFLEFNALNRLTNKFTCISYDAETHIWKQGWEGGIGITPFSSIELLNQFKQEPWKYWVWRNLCRTTITTLCHGCGVGWWTNGQFARSPCSWHQWYGSWGHRKEMAYCHWPQSVSCCQGTCSLNFREKKHMRVKEFAAVPRWMMLI